MTTEIRYDAIRSDLRFAMGFFPLASLYYLRDNRHRLVRGVYTDGEGNGCMFWLLSRVLPIEQQIDCKIDLLRFFTGEVRMENFLRPEYQPAAWLVRAVDGKICPTLLDRYGPIQELDWNLVYEVLADVIAERESLERESQTVEERALARLTAEGGCSA